MSTLYIIVRARFALILESFGHVTNDIIRAYGNLPTKPVTLLTVNFKMKENIIILGIIYYFIIIFVIRIQVLYQ